jgi:hypothetical protein
LKCVRTNTKEVGLDRSAPPVDVVGGYTFAAGTALRYRPTSSRACRLTGAKEKKGMGAEHLTACEEKGIRAAEVCGDKSKEPELF